MLGKAFVVTDGTVKSEDLRSQIEDIGFDAEVEHVGSAAHGAGTAQLHLKAFKTESPRGAEALRNLVDTSESRYAGSPAGCEALRILALRIHGVMECKLFGDSCAQITYDPAVVGARTILASLRASPELEDALMACQTKFTDHDPISLQKVENTSLLGDFRIAVLPASIILMLTIVLPAFNFNIEGDGGLLSAAWGDIASFLRFGEVRSWAHQFYRLVTLV